MSWGKEVGLLGPLLLLQPNSESHLAQYVSFFFNPITDFHCKVTLGSKHSVKQSLLIHLFHNTLSPLHWETLNAQKVQGLFVWGVFWPTKPIFQWTCGRNSTYQGTFLDSPVYSFASSVEGRSDSAQQTMEAAPIGLTSLNLYLASSNCADGPGWKTGRLSIIFSGPGITWRGSARIST